MRYSKDFVPTNCKPLNIVFLILAPTYYHNNKKTYTCTLNYYPGQPVSLSLPLFFFLFIPPTLSLSLQRGVELSSAERRSPSTIVGLVIPPQCRLSRSGVD